MARRAVLVLAFLFVPGATLACSNGSDSVAPGPGAGGGASSSTSGSGGSPSGGAGAPASSGSGAAGGSGGAAGCIDVGTDVAVPIGTAASADEYALALTAASASHTFWKEPGNEALVLEVTGARGLIGHLVLHQGKGAFEYTMALGSLDAGDEVSLRVSKLSASSATPSACVGPATLTASAALGADAEGLLRAPILRWPANKRFDDLPVLLGWSKANKSYQAVYTSENGGTVAICGGGAEGMQAEMARWGRGCDIEGIFDYGGAAPQWGRCTGTTPFTDITPVVEGLHPILYYGDGHNRLFEHRGGYGQTCGSGSDAKADGDIPGWNVQNPGNEPALDGDFVITLRPLPVALDALDFPMYSGRREALLDAYAPWIYRLTDSELTRDGKIDGVRVLSMDQYLFVDVLASDVGGSGDSYCSFLVNGGFMLRAQTKDGQTHDGPQMTSSYFGGQTNWKRIALPLAAAYAKDDVTKLVFDAFDADGIYWLSLGDAFTPRPKGDNGASLDHVHAGVTPIDVYVDDDSSGCTNGTNPDGPAGSYPCVGSFQEYAP